MQTKCYACSASIAGSCHLCSKCAKRVADSMKIESISEQASDFAIDAWEQATGQTLTLADAEELGEAIASFFRSKL